jgi:hypothetical protein
LNAFAEIMRRLLPGIWFGLLCCIAFVATPAGFAVLDHASAGALARRIFATEAPVSLAFGLLLLMIERRIGMARHQDTGASQFSVPMMLAAGTLLCTVAGYYGLLPMMEAARAGAATSLTFLQLHAISLAFFGIKGLLVLALAWKAAR